MKHNMIGFVVAVGIVALAIGGVALAQYATGTNYSEPGGTKWVVNGEISIGGNQDIDDLQVGTVDVANGATTGAATVSGVLAGDYVFIGLTENPSAATDYWVTPTTNTITVTVDTDPGTTLTFNYLWISAN